MNNKLRATIRADFVAAVFLTVLVPLVLLVRSILNGSLRHQIMPLFAYWRAAALLMVTVYLLIVRRPYAMVSGVSARIAIALSLVRFPYGDDVVTRWWVWVTVSYCLAGAAINLSQISDVRVRAEYEQATQIYAQLFHQGHNIGRLGVIGDIGLVSWLVGALLLRMRQR